MTTGVYISERAHLDDEPLELGELSPQETASITGRLADGSMSQFTEALTSVGNCSRPVALKGHSITMDASSGEVLRTFRSSDQPLGALFIACGNRRADRCPACSRVYARDMYEMVSVGLHGGRGVPEAVARNPLLFVTLTAPSFGSVHGPRCAKDQPSGRCVHGHSLRCYREHEDGDCALGAPLCWECYDWRSAALWQWHAPELWRRFTISLRRSLARALGLPAGKLASVASVQYAKVAEYQARGMVHFHTLVRLDGSDGPGSPCPVTVSMLAEAVRHAARSVYVDAPPAGTGDITRRLRFGVQLDVKTVRDSARDFHEGEICAEKVAAYLAKYSTKGSGVDPRAPKPHLRRLMSTCFSVVADSVEGCPMGCADRVRDWRPGRPRAVLCAACNSHPYALLLKWAPALAFRGHFASKSRRYSVTLGTLREARRHYQKVWARLGRRPGPSEEINIEELLAEDESTLVVGSWSFTGMGWPAPGDSALAVAAAARAREYATLRPSSS